MKSQNNNNLTQSKKILPIKNKNFNEIKMNKKEKRYLAVVDDETGEIKSYYELQTKSLGKDWVAVYQEPALWLAQQKLTGEQYSVLFYLFNKLNFDNYLRISQKYISETLDMKQQNVSRAIRALNKLHVIVEGPRAGLNKTYRLNPYIAHKGKNRKGDKKRG